VLDQSRNTDNPHGPEDALILAQKCPRCGTILPVHQQSLMSQESSRRTATCPSCGVDFRLDHDPTGA
jgi:ribosomal protein S27AE